MRHGSLTSIGRSLSLGLMAFGLAAAAAQAEGACDRSAHWFLSPSDDPPGSWGGARDFSEPYCPRTNETDTAPLAPMDRASVDADASAPPGREGLADLEDLRRRAGAGDDWALYQLALAYLEGRAVEASPEEAARLFSEAAENGNGWAIYQLALLHLDGRGLEPDATEAARLFALAAERGNDWAMYQLAALYQSGIGVEEDAAQAARFFRDAAEAGNGWAMYQYGLMLQTGSGVPRDQTQAVAFFSRAAEEEIGWAMYQLASHLRDGRGVGQDFEQSARWFEEAAEGGIALAMTELARIHESGRGVPRDLDRSAELFLRAARAGDPWLNTNIWSLARQTVRLIQTRLADAGIYLDAIDGIPGPKTRAALEQWVTQTD